MFVLRASFAVVLSLALTAALTAAPNPRQLARGRRGGIQGTVVQVHHDRSPRGAGWIKIRRGVRRHGVSAALGGGSRRHRHLMTVRVGRVTRFERMVQGANGQLGARRTSFAALRHGERVRVMPGSGRNHVARVVGIMSSGSGSGRSYGNRYASGRRYYGSGYGSGRRYGGYYGHRRHSLVGRRVVVVNRNITIRPRVVRRVTVVRPVRHSLVHGSVARRVQHHNRTHHTAAHVRKPAPPKHKTAAKPKPHKAAPVHHSRKPAHSAGHAKPHSSRRKR